VLLTLFTAVPTHPGDGGIASANRLASIIDSKSASFNGDSKSTIALASQQSGIHFD
jgi:hypothetical protein